MSAPFIVVRDATTRAELAKIITLANAEAKAISRRGMGAMLGAEYAEAHENWRYGTPEPEFAPRWDDIRGQRFGSLVVTEQRVGRFWICLCDCGATTRADAGNLNRGSKISCGDSRLHHRAGLARHWSYNHDDPDELHESGLTPYRDVAYSTKPEHYSPRCVPCHKRFDLDRIDAQRVA